MSDIDKPRKTGHNWLDILIGIAVVCISVASLWVAAGESRTQQRILAATVWPYLQYGTSNATTDEKPVVYTTIENAGTGPARLRWFTIYYRDKAYADARQLLNACCGAKGKKLWTMTSGLQNGVLTPHDTLAFIRFPKATNDPKIYEAFNKERENMYVRACYCSLLDECWLLDSRKDEPAPINDCNTPDRPLFEG